MGTLEDYFYTEQNHNVKVTQATELTASRDGLKIPAQMYLDFASGAIYFSMLEQPIMHNRLDIAIKNPQFLTAMTLKPPNKN